MDAAADLLLSLAARAEAAEKECNEYMKALDSRREYVGIDASPDVEMPVRILRAYLYDSETVTEPDHMLGKLMNKWRDERNVLINAAIAKLANFAHLSDEAQLLRERAELAERLLAEARNDIHIYARQSPEEIEAERDSKRLDWLAENSTYVGGGNGGTYTWHTPADLELGLFRQEIDAAMRSQSTSANPGGSKTT